MHGSLCLHRGALWVGRHAKTAHVRAFDLDGTPLGPGFRFRDPRLGRSAAAGLALDEDRRLWVADTPASRVRQFTVFGGEVGGIGLGAAERLDGALALDAAGVVRAPVDVAVAGEAERPLVVVASGGERRHAVQLFDCQGGGATLLASLRARGDPEARFQGVAGVSIRGPFVYVAERRGGRVQVFRHGEFHFAFRVAVRGGACFEPTAVAPLADGRMLVATAGAAGGLLFCDAAGRLTRVLAGHGREEGAVFEPNDVAVDPHAAEPDARVAVIDRDGDRVQLFSLEGRCFGVFEELAG